MVESSASCQIVARIGALHCAGGHGDGGDIVGDAAESLSRPPDGEHMRILRHGRGRVVVELLCGGS